MSNAPNPWIAFRKPNAAARLRLFCFPYAGGGAAVYRPWQSQLPSIIEVCPVQLPGREGRFRERPFTQVAPLVEAAADALEPLLEGSYAFFGHSMGALVAYELTQRLRARGRPGPEHLLVSARRPPNLPHTGPRLHDLPDDELREQLRELNGTPREVLDHPELMELMLPLLRADLGLNATHPPTAYPPLEIPITAFGGLQDSAVPRETLEAWSGLTSGRFRLQMIAGDHFFLHQELTSLLRALTDALAPHLGS